MRKLWIVLGAVALLGACSSTDGTSPVFTAIKGVVLPSKDAPAKSSHTQLTRARVTQSGLAMVRANIVGEDVTNILTATSVNGGYVTYVSGFRQSVSMLGSLVTATRGLGGICSPSPARPMIPSQRLRQWRTGRIT